MQNAKKMKILHSSSSTDINRNNFTRRVYKRWQYMIMCCGDNLHLITIFEMCCLSNSSILLLPKCCFVKHREMNRHTLINEKRKTNSQKIENEIAHSKQ